MSNINTPWHLFNVRAKLEKRIFERDEGGGTKITEVIESNFKCKIAYDNQTDDISGSPGRQTIYDMQLFCSPKLNISDGDRVTVKGSVYKVIGAVDEAEMYKFKRVSLEKEI